MKNKHQLQSEKTYQAFIDAIMEIIAKGDIEKFTNPLSLQAVWDCLPELSTYILRIKTMRSCSAIARMKRNC